MATMPTYIEYGGRVSAPPPFTGTKGRFRFLLLKGKQQQLDNLCKRVLNGPAQGAVEYRPLGHWVPLLIGQADLSSTAPGFSEMGFVRETQVSLWMPVTAGHMDGTTYVPDRMCMAVPYIWVDNPMSYVGGREDFGFPKSMGRFEPGDGLGDRVVIEAFGGDFAPTNEAHWTPVLTIERDSAATTPLPDDADIEWRVHAELTKEDLSCGIGLLADMVRSIVTGQGRQVFLKQFRDCANPTGACYQRIVEATMRNEHVHWSVSLDRWTVTVHPIQSHPIAQDLGVETQDALLVADLKMDMGVDPGQVVAP